MVVRKGVGHYLVVVVVSKVLWRRFKLLYLILYKACVLAWHVPIELK